MSDPDPTCETCHGRGWHPEETEERKRAAGDLDFLNSFDYREAYCSCPAGERLRERASPGGASS